MLDDTGERIIPKNMKPMNGMLLEHLARYYFSTPYASGRVLDIACGTGYGSVMVAKTRKTEVAQVLGVDFDADVIHYAKQNYYHPKVSFLVGDAMDPYLPNQIGTFDTILSFETIEHVKDDRLFIERMRQLLKKDGTLVLSTPFGQGRGKPSDEPFHYHQLTEEEFRSLFDSFSEKEVFYQRGVTIEPKRTNVHYAFGVAVCKK
ncbi:class I SAM-dependent methyltransferase [Halalkalibacterium halodurans]|uniref:class I SAM-dependent methyltransferase n=1 Tax=Halalkalibacterium halodurans TaxID=86665 RepID=UPI0010676EFB|nr:class I SAM-dependent methyltransferase [Halalkalibacterium halodurans]MED3645741.1 class I SAM-dependent methyltransferase [Halalkalibacterium halodurans]MED4082534.1 class I SAM-dependent methyltransferase [Halalkalibacterium halodurans]MED4085779.1 class I SAM-dependent methyltransferase [Halalkalibacterium halodurans]MED4105645.1 class I SAM-dependent methyltransferase [Halalkalibacterium halodurans]MED4107482.1 class I SAM-dependent methyltransferase [Halalkalibacterium halodurans]